MSEPDRQKDDARLRVNRSLYRAYRNLQEGRGAKVRDGIEEFMRRAVDGSGDEPEILRAAADILYARAAACPPRESWEENLGAEETENQLYCAAEVARIESETIAKESP